MKRGHASQQTACLLDPVDEKEKYPECNPGTSNLVITRYTMYASFLFMVMKQHVDEERKGKITVAKNLQAVLSTQRRFKTESSRLHRIYSFPSDLRLERINMVRKQTATLRALRDTFMEWIGFVAASLAAAGIHASNNKFNGRLIDQYRCSRLLNDDMIIRRFYLYETLIRHNFVVIQTTTGHTFKVHLIADIDPRPYWPIYVDIVPTEWRPADRSVGTCHKEAWHLKRFIRGEVQKFGTYEVGINDCRHFARTVAAFLAS